MPTIEIVDFEIFQDGDCAISDLLRSAVIELETARAPPNFNPARSKTNGIAIDPLVPIADNKERVRALGRQRPEESKLARAEVLHLIAEDSAVR